jgi:hypothetical protein
VLTVAAALASFGCGGDSNPTNPTPQTTDFKGTLVGEVGEGSSGVVTVTLPASAAASISTAGSAQLAGARAF